MLSPEAETCPGWDGIPEDWPGDPWPGWVVDWRQIAHAAVVGVPEPLCVDEAMDDARQLLESFLSFLEGSEGLLADLGEDFERHLACGCGRIMVAPIQGHHGTVGAAMAGVEARMLQAKQESYEHVHPHDGDHVH